MIRTGAACRIGCLLIPLAAFAAAAPRGGGAPPTAEVFVTRLDLSRKLEAAGPLRFDEAGAGAGLKADGAIRISAGKTRQEMLGFGSSLEPATCRNLSRLLPEEREATIERLVDPEKGIGFNLVRICIGTPDFTGDPWHSCDDMPPGQTDPELKRFTIEADRDYILPVLRIARAKNPQLLFFASPWSPPGWMKSTGTMIGGRLLPENYGAYARYFVKFIRAYEAEGVPIHAVTIQNEPGVDRSKGDPKWRYPSCRWTGAEERDFIKNHLGPAFQREGIKTEIWCYDHNYNVGATPDGDDPGIDYPRTILSDPQAARYVRGVAFHGYAGKPEGMSILAGEFPGTPIHFTEGSVFGLSGAARLVTLLGHGISGYNGWVTMLDTTGKPNNGPFRASATMIQLDTARMAVHYRFDYYMLGHFSKFVRRGARRIETAAEGSGAASVAFRNPDGETVLIVVNARKEAQRIRIASDPWGAELAADGQSVTTLRWR